MRKAITIIALLAICVAACAQTADVPQGHWAYQAVNDLAKKGLVMGYPDGNFMGNRAMTRYEMATIVKRIMDEVDQRVQEAKDEAKSAAGTKAETAPTPVVQGASQEDLDKINKLVDEFKVELSVIGADVEKLKEEIGTMQTDIDNMKATLNDPEGTVQTLKGDVSKLKKISVSGYVQARYEKYDAPAATVNKADDKSIDNRFYVRRGRFKVTGQPSANSLAVVQLDIAGFDRNTVEAKDLYLEYDPWGVGVPAPFLTRFGQQNIPFGYCIERSDADSEVPERPKVFGGTTVALTGTPSFGGLFPGERDKGVSLFSTPGSKLDWALGVFNGTGTKSAAAGSGFLVSGGKFEDNNAAKAIVGRLRFPILSNLNIGVSAYRGSQAVLPLSTSPVAVNVDQTRYGADFQLYMHGASLKGEYVTGKEPYFSNTTTTPGTAGTNRTVNGYYLLGVKNVGTKNQLVAQYDVLNDDALAGTFGKLSSWNFGMIRFLDEATKLKLFYEINNEEKGSVDNNGLRLEVITVF